MNQMPSELSQDLLLGAHIFKANLVAIGIFLIGITVLLRFKTEGVSERSQQNSEAITLWECWIVGSLLLAALALRVYGLDYGLWFDEITAYVNFVRMPTGELITMAQL